MVKTSRDTVRKKGLSCEVPVLESNDSLLEKKEVSNQTPRLRGVKRGSLPMKLRALPQSFWQQPNASGTVSPTTYCPLLEDVGERGCHSQVVGVANTELLFSLFQSVGSSEDEVSSKQPPVARRGRPRKSTGSKSAVKMTKDEDPYFTSAIIPQIPKQSDEKVAEGRQVLAMISVTGDKGEDINLNSAYSQRLSDLVVNL